MSSFKKKRPPPKFKFWHMNSSGSGEVMTEFMEQEDAIDWLHKNAMIITGVHVVEYGLEKESVMSLIKGFGE